MVTASTSPSDTPPLEISPLEPPAFENSAFQNPFYYLDNFHRVLEWIGERYGDLLDDEERRFIGQFSALPQAARALFVRMVMRKGLLFRASKLRYAEIGDPRDAALPLLAAGCIAADPPLMLPQLFELLQKAEIAAVFGLAPAEKNLRKAEQQDILATRHAETLPFSAWYPDADDEVYHVTGKALCDRLRLIFFGNFQQDWTEFILSDLGIYKYEKVEFSAASRAFRSRRDIDDYLALQQCRERFLDEGDAEAVLAQLPASVIENAWLAGRREKLRFQIGQCLEQAQDWDAAYALYSTCPYPGARARAIRVLEKSGLHARAYDCLMQAWTAPESDAERQQLQRMAPRLRRRLGHAKTGVAPAAPVRELALCLPYPAVPSHVEAVVRDHLARTDAPVYYVENTLINSLFGLLCWKAIFKPVPGAFFHPFHRGPADLHSADFQQRRALDFAACLAELDTLAYRDTICANYAAKSGIESPFVYWGVLDETLIALALDCIPATHLKKWFERILQDIQSNRSGFPDLIQFWPQQRRYDMIEVKGPGDRLQDNQKRWLAYCAEHDMPVSVCYLQWQEAALD
jgi:hypothetical protein